MELKTKDFEKEMKNAKKTVDNFAKSSDKNEVKLTANASELEKEVDKASSSVKELNGTEANAQLDAKDNASEVVDEVASNVSELDNIEADAELGATDSASEIVDEVTDSVKSLDGTEASAELTATDSATEVVGEVISGVQSLDGASAEVDISVNQDMSGIEDAENALASIDGMEATASISVDASELEEAEATLQSFGDTAIDLAGKAKWASAGATASIGLIAKGYLEGGEAVNRYTKVFGDNIAKMDAHWEKNRNVLAITREEYAGLTAGMGDLLKPMGFTADEAASMTQEVTDMAGAFAKWGSVPIEDVFGDIQKAMLGSTKGLEKYGVKIKQTEVKERAAIVAKREGIEATDNMALALATQEIMIEKSADAISNYEEKSGEATSAMDKWKATQNNFNQMLEDFGNTMGPVIEVVVEGLMNLTQMFVSMPKPVQAAILGILGLVAILAPLLSLIGFMAIGLSGLASVGTAFTAVTGILSGALGALGTAFTFLTGPIGLALIAIVGLGIIFFKFKDQIFAFCEETGARISEWFASIGVWFGELGTNITNFFTTYEGGFNQFLEGVFQLFLSYGSIFLDFWIGIFSAIGFDTEGWKEKMVGIFQAFWIDGDTILQSLYASFSNLFSNMFANIGTLGQTWKDNMISLFQAFWKDGDGIINSLFLSFQSAFSGIGSLVSGVMSGVVSNVVNAVNQVISAIERMKATVSAGVASAKKAVASVDLNPFNGKSGKTLNTNNNDNSTTTTNQVSNSTIINNNVVVQSGTSAITRFAGMKGLTI